MEHGVIRPYRKRGDRATPSSSLTEAAAVLFRLLGGPAALRAQGYVGRSLPLRVVSKSVKTSMAAVKCRLRNFQG